MCHVVLIKAVECVRDAIVSRYSFCARPISVRDLSVKPFKSPWGVLPRLGKGLGDNATKVASIIMAKEHQLFMLGCHPKST